MIAFIENNREKVALESVDVKSVRFGLSKNLNESTVESANLLAPLILAEIRPGTYNVIDGHHRLEKAFRLGVEKLPAYKLTAAQHIPFLTSQEAYFEYVDYWNSKIENIYV